MPFFALTCCVGRVAVSDRGRRPWRNLVVDQVDRLLGDGVEKIVQRSSTAQREASLREHRSREPHFHYGRLQAAALLLDPGPARADLHKQKRTRKNQPHTSCLFLHHNANERFVAFNRKSMVCTRLGYCAYLHSVDVPCDVGGWKRPGRRAIGDDRLVHVEPQLLDLNERFVLRLVCATRDVILILYFFVSETKFIQFWRKFKEMKEYVKINYLIT